MSLQKDNLEELRNFIRRIVREELNEANVSSNIDGGEGPPSVPHWGSGGKIKKRKYNWSKLKKKKKAGYVGGHKKPTVLGYMLAIDPKLRKTS